MIPSNKCLVEMRQLSFLASEATRRGNASEAQEFRKRAEALGNTGLSSDELRAKYVEGLAEETGANKKSFLGSSEYRNRFDRYLANKADEVEFRDFQVGQQTATWTQGLAGGYLVPFADHATMRAPMAQVDPVLDENVTDFSLTDCPFLQPSHIRRYDPADLAAIPTP